MSRIKLVSAGQAERLAKGEQPMRWALESVRSSAVFRRLQASNATQHFGTQGACVLKPGRVFPRLVAGLVISLSLVLPAFGLPPPTFPDEAKAQQHCPKDMVVWSSG
jgi:hypothetical protein